MTSKLRSESLIHISGFRLRCIWIMYSFINEYRYSISKQPLIGAAGQLQSSKFKILASEVIVIESIFSKFQACVPAVLLILDLNFDVLLRNSRHLWTILLNASRFPSIYLVWDHSFSTSAKSSEKLTFLSPWYAHIRTHTCAYQGIRNASFSENFAEALNEWSLIENRPLCSFPPTSFIFFQVKSAKIGCKLEW